MNRTTNALNTKSTPYELWHKKKSNIPLMKPFGSDAFVLVPKIYRTKFDANVTKSIHVGYQHTPDKNYRICNEARNKVAIARDVVFNNSERKRRVDFIKKESSFIKANCKRYTRKTVYLCN